MHRQACFDGCFVELRPADGKYTAAEFKQIIDHCSAQAEEAMM